jgi:hypothetical protein
LTSLYNVVAWFCNSLLYVKRVKKIAVDPFISFETVYSVSVGLGVAKHEDSNSPGRTHSATQTMSPLILFGPSLLYQTEAMEQPDEEPESEDEDPEAEELRKHEEQIMQKPGTHWRTRKELADKHYKENKQKEQVKKEKEKKKPPKRSAQYMLVNYETRSETLVQLHLPRGWRLFQIKMANHSHWVFSLYNDHKREFMDIVASPSL